MKKKNKKINKVIRSSAVRITQTIIAKSNNNHTNNHFLEIGRTEI